MKSGANADVVSADDVGASSWPSTGHWLGVRLYALGWAHAWVFSNRPWATLQPPRVRLPLSAYKSVAAAAVAATHTPRAHERPAPAARTLMARPLARCSVSSTKDATEHLPKGARSSVAYVELGTKRVLLSCCLTEIGFRREASAGGRAHSNAERRQTL